MKLTGRLVALVVAAVLLCAPAYAADPRYPDWPCAQAKVPDLSVAAIWDGPAIDKVGNSWQDDAKAKDLVAVIAARRTPLDVAQKAINEFMAGKSAAEKQSAGTAIFAGAFDMLNQQRSEVMSGIERVARAEKDLADKIRSNVTVLHELEDKSDHDQAKADDLAKEVEWSTRVFEDRRKTIRYVCEVPGTIEQRLFALSRMIRQTMK